MEEKILISRIQDLCKQASRGNVVVSDFLDLRQQELASLVINYIKNTNFDYFFYGGFSEAERKRLIISPQWQENPDNLIKCIEIKPIGKNGYLEHRDYLGALLNLGIKREKLGDIVIQNGSAYLFVDSLLVDYIIINLTKVKKLTVRLQQFFGEFEYINPGKKYIKTTIPSLRLDAVVSAAFNMPRSDSSRLISGEYVKVNQKTIIKNSHIVNEKDLISVRGKGRVTVEELGGITRKNRHHVLLSL
ncbi:Putative RNA-binding protein YlmH [Candidatus Syntrophocurvum alkaliphilum]|uniref:RNA-binding protein YlmH n=1 Tax=Candidatus Syntrophocurvum alkaliphilum TaxID=2293317 RepID=A0A6I6DGB5_9FIRM|nr:Putative RNA-binding protein YlmH [Candidatus Syntrophocurvum alkaliphilum]